MDPRAVEASIRSIFPRTRDSFRWTLVRLKRGDVGDDVVKLVFQMDPRAVEA